MTGAGEDFAAALAHRAAAAERALDAALPAPAGQERRVVAAMRHGALGGGKRLRAFLVLECAALTGGPESGATRAAAALECVHAYSLIHDDLPAMDDDDLRRGKPTAHIAFDEATAILAGDALQTRAFELLAAPETHADPATRCATIARLAAASGAAGMVGGQMLDILAERADAEPPDLAETERLQAMKTGALIGAACWIGGRLGTDDEDTLAALDAYAAALGLAFQIRDDLLDHEGDEAAAGKRLRKDAEMGKATFVDLLGPDGARARAVALAAAAKDALPAPDPSRPESAAAATLLRHAADFSITRTR